MLFFALFAPCIISCYFPSEYDYHYDDYEYDLCSNPDEAHVTTGGCSHNQFFDLSAVKKLQNIEKYSITKTRFCCTDHEYVFKDYCEVSKVE